MPEPRTIYHKLKAALKRHNPVNLPDTPALLTVEVGGVCGVVGCRHERTGVFQQARPVQRRKQRHLPHPHQRGPLGRLETEQLLHGGDGRQRERLGLAWPRDVCPRSGGPSLTSSRPFLVTVFACVFVRVWGVYNKAVGQYYARTYG